MTHVIRTHGAGERERRVQRVGMCSETCCRGERREEKWRGKDRRVGEGDRRGMEREKERGGASKGKVHMMHRCNTSHCLIKQQNIERQRRLDTIMRWSIKINRAQLYWIEHR